MLKDHKVAFTSAEAKSHDRVEQLKTISSPDTPEQSKVFVAEQDIFVVKYGVIAEGVKCRVSKASRNLTNREFNDNLNAER